MIDNVHSCRVYEIYKNTPHAQNYSYAETPDKGDPRILDCLLYFAAAGADVTLCVQDRNFNLAAHIHNMQVLTRDQMGARLRLGHL